MIWNDVERQFFVTVNECAQLTWYIAYLFIYIFEYPQREYPCPNLNTLVRISQQLQIFNVYTSMSTYKCMCCCCQFVWAIKTNTIQMFFASFRLLIIFTLACITFICINSRFSTIYLCLKWQHELLVIVLIDDGKLPSLDMVHMDPFQGILYILFTMDNS